MSSKYSSELSKTSTSGSLERPQQQTSSSSATFSPNGGEWINSIVTTTINSTLKSSEGCGEHGTMFVDANTFRQMNLLDASWPSEIGEQNSFRNHLNVGNTAVITPCLSTKKCRKPSRTVIFNDDSTCRFGVPALPKPTTMAKGQVFPSITTRSVAITNNSVIPTGTTKEDFEDRNPYHQPTTIAPIQTWVDKRKSSLAKRFIHAILRRTPKRQSISSGNNN